MHLDATEITQEQLRTIVTNNQPTTDLYIYHCESIKIITETATFLIYWQFTRRHFVAQYLCPVMYPNGTQGFGQLLVKDEMFEKFRIQAEKITLIKYFTGIISVSKHKRTEHICGILRLKW